MMDFSEALKGLKMGNTMSRQGWNGNTKTVMLQVPGENSKMKQPYFYEEAGSNHIVPWVPTPADLMAEDWYLVV